MQEEVSRIINSNVCETIASTVSRNQEEIDELEQLFRERSQQILEIQRKIAGEVSFFEGLHQRNRRVRSGCTALHGEVAAARKELAGLKATVGTQLERALQELFVWMAPLLKDVADRHEQQLQTLAAAYSKQTARLQSEMAALQDSLEREKQTTADLRRINSELKKQELSRIFHRKPANDACSRRNTADSDILRTLEPAPELDITRITQPSLQLTVDFSRKRSMIVSASAVEIMRTEFDFEQLVEERYEGKLLAGRKVARGIDYYENGWCYRGEFVRGTRHGAGVLLHHEEEVYSGEWANGVFHGKGKLSRLCGRRDWRCYCGSFENGRIEGLGTVTLVDGGMLVSTFRNGQPQSQALSIAVDESVAYGEYKKGAFHRQL